MKFLRTKEALASSPSGCSGASRRVLVVMHDRHYLVCSGASLHMKWDAGTRPIITTFDNITCGTQFGRSQYHKMKKKREKSSAHHARTQHMDGTNHRSQLRLPLILKKKNEAYPLSRSQALEAAGLLHRRLVSNNTSQSLRHRAWHAESQHTNTPPEYV